MTRDGYPLVDTSAPEAPEKPSEKAKLMAWRYSGLRELGVEHETAFEICERDGIVHAVADLVNDGCNPELAVKIAS